VAPAVSESGSAERPIIRLGFLLSPACTSDDISEVVSSILADLCLSDFDHQPHGSIATMTGIGSTSPEAS
jgi:hypothetical protein